MILETPLTALAGLDSYVKVIPEAVLHHSVACHIERNHLGWLRATPDHCRMAVDFALVLNSVCDSSRRQAPALSSP